MGVSYKDLANAPHRVRPSNAAANRSELNPVHFLARTATVYPSKVAVIHENRRYTYKELSRRSVALAYALKEQFAIERGDRVAVIAPNIPALLEAHFGIPAANGIICAINTRLAPKEVDYILQHSGAKVILCDMEFKDLVKDSTLPKVFIADSGLPTDPYEQFLKTGYSKADTLGWSGLEQTDNEDDGISLCYTSGTTGKPKGVLYTYRGIYLSALGNAIEAELRLDSVHLFLVPLFHANSWIFPYAVTALAATHVMIRKIDYDQIWDLILNENVTHLNGAPTIMIQLVHNPKAVKLPKALTCTVAGSAPTATLIASMKELNMDICHVYGLTETYGPITKSYPQIEWNSLTPEERAKQFSRQGHVYLVSDDVRVVDTEMKDVAWDGKQVGEIVFRGNLVMKGYHNDPEATAQAFHGGWFHSGDLAVRHADGYIAIQDRSKDIIISGGENISTLEVESCISQHPSVLEVAVVAAPSKRWGETPKGFVVLKPGLSNDKIVDGPQLIAFCKERMAGFKCPSAIVVIKELPKTSTGKIQKYVLRDQEWKGHAKRVN
ncbi:AMP-dependent synthetase and ligase [Dissophora ornata]|nr:AMP-dependent synthetase and ligase [Dissophora ornata]